MIFVVGHYKLRLWTFSVPCTITLKFCWSRTCLLILTLIYFLIRVKSIEAKSSGWQTLDFKPRSWPQRRLTAVNRHIVCDCSHTAPLVSGAAFLEIFKFIFIYDCHHNWNSVKPLYGLPCPIYQKICSTKSGSTYIFENDQSRNVLGSSLQIFHQGICIPS